MPPHTHARYRLIALDLDGTTLTPKGTVAPRTRAVIQELVRRGVYVCFATGRNFTESRHVLEEAGHFATAVFVGGANVVNTAAGRSLLSRAMPPDLARELCADLDQTGHAVLALQDTFATGVDYLVSESALDRGTAKWMDFTRATVRTHPSLSTYDHPHTLRVGLVAPHDEVATIHDHLQQKYGTPNRTDGSTGRVMMHSISIPSEGVDVLELFDPGVNKWEGVRFVADTLGIHGDQVVAVGDELNDLAMLRHAGLGVAMGNAHPTAKSAARLTIGSNADDGLAAFLEDLIHTDRIAPA